MIEFEYFIYEFGAKRWRNHKDEYHRLSGPAVEHDNGTRMVST